MTKKETERKKYSVAGIVRARFHQIEKLSAEGITQEGIVELLNAELKAFGFTTSVENFRNELYRARKRAKAEEQKAREAAEAAGVTYEPPQMNQAATQTNKQQSGNNQPDQNTPVNEAADGSQVIQRSRGPLVIAAPSTKRFVSRLDKVGENTDEPNS